MGERHWTPSPCPMCGVLPPINLVGVYNGYPKIGCMNICCKNMVQFEGKTLGEALGKWDAWVIKNRKEEVSE